MTLTDEMVLAGALAVRKRRMELNGIGHDFDPTIPPSDEQLDLTRAALTAALSDQAGGWRADIESAFKDRPVFMLREDGTPTVACLEGVVWRDDQEAQIFPLAWMPVPISGSCEMKVTIEGTLEQIVPLFRDPALPPRRKLRSTRARNGESLRAKRMAAIREQTDTLRVAFKIVRRDPNAREMADRLLTALIRKEDRTPEILDEARRLISADKTAAPPPSSTAGEE